MSYFLGFCSSLTAVYPSNTSSIWWTFPKHQSIPPVLLGPNSGAPTTNGNFSRSSLQWTDFGPQGQTRSYKPLQQVLTGPAVQHQCFATEMVLLCSILTACSSDNSACLALQLSLRKVRSRFVSGTVSDFLCSENNQRICLKCVFRCQALQHPCATSVTAVTGGENKTWGDERLLQFPEKRHLTAPETLLGVLPAIATWTEGHKPPVARYRVCRILG